MTVKLDLNATEQSTYVVTVSFFDEDGNAVAPTAAVWSLTDKDGNVINFRSYVTMPIATTGKIVLTKLDLPPGELILTIQALYDSANGTGLQLMKQLSFSVEELVEILVVLP